MQMALDLCSIVLVGLISIDSHAYQAPTSPWASFGVGSWVVVHTQMTGPEQSTEQRLKMIIVRNQNGMPEVGIARYTGGKFESPFRTGKQVIGFWPIQLGMKLVHTKAGYHAIDGDNYSCTVKTYRVNDRKHHLTRILKLWHAKNVEVPYREIIVDRGANVALEANVVKVIYEVHLVESTTLYELKVMKLDETIQAGGENLPCAVELCTAQTVDGDHRSTVKTYRWLSPRIPGHVVKLDGSIQVDGAEFRKVQRVKSFKVMLDL